MAGTDRFHSKYHNTIHDTLSTPGYPDSAQDPIASPSQPFQGGFFIQGNLSAANYVIGNVLSAYNIAGQYLNGVEMNQAGNTVYIQASANFISPTFPSEFSFQGGYVALSAGFTGMNGPSQIIIGGSKTFEVDNTIKLQGNDGTLFNVSSANTILSFVETNSAGWNLADTWVSSNSALLNYSVLNAHYLPLTGGSLTSNLSSLSAVTASLFTVNNPGAGNPTFKTGVAGGSGSTELGLIANAATNTLFLQQLDRAGFNATAYRDISGNEHAAFGTSADPNAIPIGYDAYRGNMFFEITDANNAGYTPSFVINQHSSFNGAKSLGGNVRFWMDSNTGYICFFPRGMALNQFNGYQTGITLQSPYGFAQNGQTFSFDPDLPILTVGGGPSFFGQGDLSYGRINLGTNAFSIIGRPGGNSGPGATDYSCSAGFLSAGGGHRFYINGTQTQLSFQIAFDITQSFNDFCVGKTANTNTFYVSATTGNTSTQGYLSSNSVVYASGGNSNQWNTTYNLLSSGGLSGTGNASNAQQGNVGEYSFTQLASGSPISLATNQAGNVLSASLAAGDWNVWGTVDYILGAATTTAFKTGVSTASAAFAAQDSYAKIPLVTTVLSDTFSHVIPIVRYNVSTATTVFLVGQASFSGGTVTAYGTLNARRIR